MWRFADAALGLENPGSDGKSLRKRAAAGFIGAIYLYMAYKAVRGLVAGSAGAVSPQQQAEWRRALLPVQQQMAGRIGKDLIDDINRTTAEVR